MIACYCFGMLCVSILIVGSGSRSAVFDFARKAFIDSPQTGRSQDDRQPSSLSTPSVVPTAPEQIWVADITYVPTQEGVAYLSLVTDAFSRKIVGYHVHESLHAESVAQALRRAVKRRRTEQPLVHHSDRGSQYCAGMYQALHAKHGIRCSMTDGYDCYQNALAERVNGILKTAPAPEATGFNAGEEDGE
jgi:putative transposase